MTTDDTAAKILKREYYLDDEDLPYHDLHDMATLWMMRGELIAQGWSARLIQECDAPEPSATDATLKER